MDVKAIKAVQGKEKKKKKRGRREFSKYRQRNIPFQEIYDSEVMNLEIIVLFSFVDMSFAKGGDFYPLILPFLLLLLLYAYIHTNAN